MPSSVRLFTVLIIASGLVLSQETPGLKSLDARRAQYAELASNLVTGLADGKPAAELNLEPAALEAKERWRVIQMGEIETEDRKIRAVAKEAASAHEAVLRVAKESGDDGMIVDLALAMVLESPWLLARSISREAHSGNAARFGEVVQRRRAATFLLPELAAELAGPKQDAPVLELDFDENWFGMNKPDRLNIRNSSERRLGNCTLQIDIRGANGKWVRNIHFVPTWDAGAMLWADYMSSDPTQLASISGTTATEVQDIKVSLWCNELNSVSEIHYPGALRDADRLAQLNQLLTFEADYVGEPFFEQGPCIGVKLGGVDRLRKCKVLVVCHGGNQVDQKLEMSIADWQAGERISLQSRGALLGCPRSVEILVKCDGFEKGVSKTVEISRSR